MHISGNYSLGRALLNCSGLAAFLAFSPGAWIHSAQATCSVNNTQCKVTDGSTYSSPSWMNFVPMGAGKDQAALVVTGYSFVQGSNLTITAPSTSGYYAGFVSSGGQIDLTDSTISGWTGLYATGAGSSITMQGGSLTSQGTTSWPERSALWLAYGASATLRNVDVKSDGAAIAVMLDPNGSNSFSMEGGSITGLQLGAILSGNGNHINLKNVDILTGGSWGVSTYGDNNTLNMLGGTVIYSGNQLAIRVGGGTAIIDGTAITSAGHGVMIQGTSTSTASLHMQNKFDIQTSGDSHYGVNINSNGKADLKDGRIVTYGNNSIGIRAFSPSDFLPLFAERITVETHGANAHGIYSDNGLSTLRDVDIKINDLAFGLAGVGATTDVRMQNGRIDAVGNNALAAFAHAGAHLEFDHVKLDSLNNTTGGAGLWVQSGSEAVLKNNTVLTTDGAFAPALVFRGNTAANKITVDDSSVTAQDSFAVLANGGTDRLDVINSKIEGDRLIYAGNCSAANCGLLVGSVVDVNAVNSQLSGHASVSALSRLSMKLDQNSLWTIRPSAAGVLRSDVSFLELDESSILFDYAGTGSYQELVVGSGNLGGSSAVYKAGQNASLGMNVFVNTGGTLANQFTDRLLIEGDVSGTTFITINTMVGSPGGLTSSTGQNLSHEGISLVQVAGAASEMSFALADGYTTLGGLPYQYALYAYGSGSANGAADATQKLVTTGSNHWDFRLQTQGSVAPQTANYLVAPTALFQAQYLDMGSLHQRLGDIRLQSATDPDAGRSTFFLRAYGGDYAWRSSLDQAQYGYDADIRYTAMQAGSDLYGFETEKSLLRFGLSAAYGGLSFEPRHVKDSRRTDVDLWSVSPYMTWQHQSGAYVDVIVNYGQFDGWVDSASRSHTARLRGRAVAASVETGIELALPAADWSLEPQLQIIYQQLSFEQMHDIDNFPVALGRLEQTTVRAGAKIQKQLVDDPAGKDIKLYGKLHLTHAFHGDRDVWFGDTFQIGDTGTHLELGAGLSAILKDKVQLYGDAVWKGSLSNHGSKGLSLNGGLRINF